MEGSGEEKEEDIDKVLDWDEGDKSDSSEPYFDWDEKVFFLCPAHCLLQLSR